MCIYSKFSRRKGFKLRNKVFNSPYLDLQKHHKFLGTDAESCAGYNLVCVLSHDGSTSEGGHYVCDIRTCMFFFFDIYCFMIFMCVPPPPYTKPHEPSEQALSPCRLHYTRLNKSCSAMDSMKSIQPRRYMQERIAIDDLMCMI